MRWCTFCNKTSLTLSTCIIQTILKSIIQSLVPKFIRLGCEKFIITKEWFGQFVKQYMCWTYHGATTIARKLPPDSLAQIAPWFIRLLILRRHIPFHQFLLWTTIKLKSILSLMVMRNVQILSLEDKNKFTMVVSFIVAWDLLPLQIMFIGTISRLLPSNN
jgi:hypothetical protein